MIKAKINYMQNPINDELYTPKYAIIPLLKYIKKDMIIWECTDFGESNITKVFKENGYNVISTNKKDFDFLIDYPNFKYDIIITNPPYSIKDKFIEKCYELKKPFCLLMPLTTLEGKKRNELFSKYGIQLLVYDGRINFINNKKANWFNTSWFCYNILPHDLMFEKLEKEEEIIIENKNLINNLNIFDFI